MPLVPETCNTTCICLWTQSSKNMQTSFFLQTCHASEPVQQPPPEAFSGQFSSAQLCLVTQLAALSSSQRGHPWPLCKHQGPLVFLSPGCCLFLAKSFPDRVRILVPHLCPPECKLHDNWNSSYSCLYPRHLARCSAQVDVNICWMKTYYSGIRP